jgi:Protein of unknown function (DUF3102)
MPAMMPESVDVEAILDEAENKIRAHSRLVLKNVVAIGEALVDVKSRVPPGRYTEFVTQRLGWTERAAQRFVSVYQMFCKLPATQSLDGKTDKLSGLDDLRIPISALYLLAQPSTPEEVRAQVLEMATRPSGVSLKETRCIIDETKQSVPPPAPRIVTMRVTEEHQSTPRCLSAIPDRQTAPILSHRDMVTCAIRGAEQRLVRFQAEFSDNYGYIRSLEPICDLLHAARDKVRQLLQERSAAESTPDQ